MKMPAAPPTKDELWREMVRTKREAKILWTSREIDDHHYRHWDEVRYRPPPPGLSHREWWLAIKLRRSGPRTQVPLRSTNGLPFSFTLTDGVMEHIHELDRTLGSVLEVTEPVATPELRDRYIVQSLMEEAFTSSRIEGAVATRREAREMLHSGRKPRNKSEQMIVNNYITMQRIRELKKEPLTPELIFDLHRLITADTLDDPADAGRLRQPNETIRVDDIYGTVFHVPPPAPELEQRLGAMCEFANQKTPKAFVHPVLRAIILHFWLAYDHPFVDGNGRTARALFYWSILRQGYWLAEFLSISQFILRAPIQYYRAFLHTETDDNDLTYFLVHQIDVMGKARDALHAHLKAEAKRTQALRTKSRVLSLLNLRQVVLIEHALKHPGFDYTIYGHRRSHSVSYATARSDLLELEKKGLLRSFRVGREFHFRPSADLEARLRNSS